MKLQAVVVVACIAWSATFAEAAPRCRPAKNKAIATKAFRAAIKDAKHPVRLAYEQFLDKYDELDDARNAAVPADANPREFYRKPVENGWVQVIATGKSPGHEGESKDDATPICVDEYLVVTSVPVEYNWHGERLYFAVAVSVANNTKGTATRMRPLQLVAMEP